MNKETLRKLFLEKRQTLTPEEHKIRSEKICNQAIEIIQASKFKYIHIFLPIDKFSEVDTQPIFDFLIHSPDHFAATSKCDFNNGSLEHFVCDISTRFATNKYGIKEPINGQPIQEKELQLIFVPLISFDRKGMRIGYGGGFYDKFLNKCLSKCVKTGLALTPPLDNIDYSESYDIPLDNCLTHHALYNFIK